MIAYQVFAGIIYLSFKKKRVGQSESKNILDKFYETTQKLESIKVDNDSFVLPKELEECFYDDLNISKVFAFLNKIIKKKENFETDKAKKNLNSENKMREAILDGIDPKEAYLKYGKF